MVGVYGRARSRLWVALGVLLIALLALAPHAARAAEGERVLDPLLSLIGGCKEETLDPVEDPGCPGNPFPTSAHPPAGIFADPRAVTTDFSGNVYVASFGKQSDGSQGRIDIFSPEGVFVSEIESKPELGNLGPKALAVDSQGVLYAVVVSPVSVTRTRILRYVPSAMPKAGEVEYLDPPEVVVADNASSYLALAVNPDDDHLFVNFQAKAVEYSSAADGNAEVRQVGLSVASGIGIAVDGDRNRLYATVEVGDERRVEIFDMTSLVGEPPGWYEKVGSIDDTSLPGEDLGSFLSVAVDEGSGHVFVFDTFNKRLYGFDEDAAYVETIEFDLQSEFYAQIGVDNGSASPNKGYLYVPSHKIGTGHSFAFKESQIGAPDVTSAHATGIGESEAEVVAEVNPRNSPTDYRIEYTTREAFEAEGFKGATVADQGTLAAGNLDVEVSSVLTGLQPGRPYRFRALAENEIGFDDAQAAFATYPRTPLEPEPCPNSPLRVGLSALLPDCRAFELVTPPDTNGRTVLGTTREINSFTTRQVSPAGGALSYKVEGGSLPGFSGGTGSLLGDPYLATRTPTGWQTTYVGPTGAETVQVIPGGTSPDQGYNFWVAQGLGSAVKEGLATTYLRFPDGHSELLGQGGLGTDPQAVGQLISAEGEHVLFISGGTYEAVQLEPEAAPDGTTAIYDRQPDPLTGQRQTEVVSVKPGGGSFGAGEDATYMGSSLNGEGIAFRVGGVLYLRYRGTETYAIGSGLTYAGVAAGGERVFFQQGGDLKAFDAGTEEVLEFSQTGDVTPVFLAAGGSAAYFLSPSVLAGPNPRGQEPQLDGKNLYLSIEGELSFVATVTDRDAEGELISGIEKVDGLGLWVGAANPSFPGRFGVVPARATPEGKVLIFKSRAMLTDYDPEGHAEIYRYDAAAGDLHCLSCNPTGAAPDSDATLQTERRGNIALFFSQAWLENLRSDGRRAFFETGDPLVSGDNDGLKDVYEWEANGVGSCTRPQGCLALITSRRSSRDEYLWAVSPSGEDVFFLSSELLVGADAESTPSIYDARVGGGFAEARSPSCEGESCRPDLAPPLPVPEAATPVRNAGENFEPSVRCGKGKRRVKRAGGVRCVKKKHRKHVKHHRQRGRAGGGGGR